MRIALILTGGTICSRTAADGARRSDVGTAVTLLEKGYRNAHPYGDLHFDVTMPMNSLSEDLTPEDWRTLLRAVADVDCKAVSGIIIAHGTDTLEQTAAMLSAALIGIGVPVILVSAIAPLTEPQTNGHANFAAAVRLIRKKLMPGVWAVYENSDGEMYLHRGFELQQCQHGSISFYSEGMRRVSDVLEEEPVKAPPDRLDRTVLRKTAGTVAEVLLLQPYNGLRYDNIPLEGVGAVVHGTYHSETANSLRYSPYAVQTLLMRCQAEQIPCFLAPCRMTEQSYGSSYDLVQAGAIPLEDMPLPLAYAAVWLCLMQGLSGGVLTDRVRQLRHRLDSQFFRCCI